ncbi:MAG: YraN family protein [Akkermansiaceae bacterium]|jgi:putative endonuclease|nr:YraN family protein [Akkermansiaceae bacterium]MDP4647800.1 YraN family protein [Akkermansiaceae bacterium]MDP4848592.1 YraN family protein [Akkermansiaceae bacterium]MDP4995367.1 YraN family protein [Akkermansiaceae bacterium]
MGLVAIIVGRFSRYLNSPFHSRTGPSGARKWMGDYGEKVARDWLRARNCKVLARNFKGRKGGEVDIVAREGRQLLFIEVKTRRKDAAIRGLAAVNRKKQSLIERGANEWLRRLGTRDVPWRFDVIEVEVADGEKPVVGRIENVFGNSRQRRKW